MRGERCLLQDTRGKLLRASRASNGEIPPAPQVPTRYFDTLAKSRRGRSLLAPAYCNDAACCERDSHFCHARLIYSELEPIQMRDPFSK